MDLAAHLEGGSTPYAGITQIRFQGRWPLPPSQPVFPGSPVSTLGRRTGLVNSTGTDSAEVNTADWATERYIASATRNGKQALLA